MKSSILRTKIPDEYKALPEIPFCTYRKYRPSCHIPASLLDSCSFICDNEIQPQFWEWTPKDVADWVEEILGRSDLREAFITNEIDGKGLIFLEADKLPRISIKNFEVIKEITSAMRNLCNTDQDQFKRCISLPIREVHTLFCWYKTLHTGPSSYFMTISKYLKEINVIRTEVLEKNNFYSLLNHWNRLPPYRPWCPQVMIGSHRRLNPMTGTTQRQVFNPKDYPVLLKDLTIYRLPS